MGFVQFGIQVVRVVPDTWYGRKNQPIYIGLVTACPNKMMHFVTELWTSKYILRGLWNRQVFVQKVERFDTYYKSGYWNNTENSNYQKTFKPGKYCLFKGNIYIISHSALSVISQHS